MSYIYRITSPSAKIYIGQSTISEYNKKQSYKFAARKKEHNNRYIINAIKKYGWENMLFEIIQDCTGYTSQELGAAETKWIATLNSQDRKIGYNNTAGGDGVDSVTAKNLALRYYKNQTADQKADRAKSCSIGQEKRYAEAGDSIGTRSKKSISHRGAYLIEAPDGRRWQTKLGLKKFAEDFADETGISYWALFGAYRNKDKILQRPEYKNANKWKVIRQDV